MVLNISQPNNPITLGTRALPLFRGVRAMRLDAPRNRLFLTHDGGFTVLPRFFVISSTDKDLQTVSVNDPANPQFVSNVTDLSTDIRAAPVQPAVSADG